MTTSRREFAALGTCPLPAGQPPHILLGHGSGGRLTAALVRDLFVRAFDNPVLARLEDQATIDLPVADAPRLAFTTDAFVVRPIFFPGGDIGRLAVHGTVNDLAVGGARPLYLAAAFVLEEGLALVDLARVVASMRAACDDVGVQLVAGDTKVVDRGKGDQIFITTTGIGLVRPDCALASASARPGDQVLVSGPIGDHGIAILSVREGLAFDTPLQSDCAPLVGLAGTILDACPHTRCMRDPTRGGVASALNEIAAAAGVGIRLDEDAIPVRPAVHGACELLGLDPLYVACEGRLLAIVPPADAERTLAAMRARADGADSARIGEIVADHPATVTLRSRIGGERIVSLLAGEQLPRIC